MASMSQYRDARTAPAPSPYHPQQHAPLPALTNQGYSELAPLAPGTQPVSKEPMPRSRVHNGRRYELFVAQQPQRARMCGFGDKDRRPITPPPCVRLKITDAVTCKEIDCNEIDHSMFVLNVDLWDEKGVREVNLVRHSPSSPSISATTAVSYGQISDATPAYSSILPVHPAQRDMHPYQPATYNQYPSAAPIVNPYGQPPQSQYAQGAHQYPSEYPPAPASHMYPPQNGYSQQSTAGGHPIYYGQSQAGYQPADQAAAPRMQVSNTPPTGMYTRNLIGSLAASAFRLTDPDDRIGIWFVLQDLSVRTEGIFRLRFSFVNVGVVPSPTSADRPQGAGHHPQQQQILQQVNTGKAPVLAACFSDSFTVYSAKRFPGVVESTPLSKCFATQGIKIPIRKDGPGRGRNEDDED